MVYVGVDLHRKRSHGEVVVSRRIGNAPAEFLRVLGEHRPVQARELSTYYGGGQRG